MRNVAWMAVLWLALAPGLRAEEPESPHVRPDGSPVVADPDLQEAAPAVRSGSEEPLGGFKDAGLKGRSGFSLGWDQVAVLGWTHWYTDGFALRASVGGKYSDSQNGPIGSELSERVGLRFVAARLGSLGRAFWQLSAGARQKHSYQETQSSVAGGTKYSITDDYTHSYQAALDLGAEVFWPGSTRVSLEASAGLAAVWTFSSNGTATDYQPGTAGVTTSGRSSGRSFEAGTHLNGVSTALNVYF